MRPHTKDLMLPLLACAAIFGCGDLLPSSPALAATHARMLGDLTCTVTPRESRLVCAPSGSAEPGGARRAILGNGQIRMASANVSMDTVAHVLQATVTVQNLLGYALGTPDGTTVSGVKVFYSAGPAVTAYVSPGDTGTVTVRNADSTGNFTAAHQPYYLYDQILQPAAVSAPRLWQWNWPKTVASFSFQVKVFAATQQDQIVPATPPRGWLIPSDSVGSLLSPANSSLRGPRRPGSYPRKLLLVHFAPGSTSDERQSVLDQVQGRVVGGIGPFYIVQIPSDSTNSALWAAIDQISKLPQVILAGPDEFENVVAYYVRPNDGPGWRKADWQIDVDSARGDNWAPEAVGIPSAWGCEKGQHAATVAIVDKQEPGAPHFQWVASIVNQPPNDSLGLAGIMWDGTVRVSDANRGDPTDSAHLSGVNLAVDIDSAIASSDVVNFSWGMGYVDATQHARLPHNDTTDHARAQAFANALSDLIRTSEATHARHPLYVIAAGNFQMDAALSGTPLLATDTVLRSRVVVVAASDSTHAGPLQRQLWANSGDPVERGSDTGSLISLVAPGNEVMVVANGGATRVMGTSFAAPHVAGAAGLLRSFDSRISPDSLKILLVQGALRGGSSSGGFPYLNAYESLKLAAERKGAPVCGNAVWTDGKGVFVQRGGSAIDTLYNDTTSIRPRGVDVLYGGRHIRVNLSPGYQDYSTDLVFRNGSWQHATTPVAGWQPYVDSSGGSYLSGMSRPLSHDRDVIAYDVWDKTDGNLLVKVGPTATTNASSPYNLTVQRTMAGAATTTTCTITGLDADTTHFCSGRTLYSPMSEFSGWGVVLLPGGKEVAISFSRLRSEWQPGGWTPCTIDNNQPMLCRTLQGRDWYPESELFIERIADHVVTQHFTIPNVGIRAMRVDETGSHLIAEYQEGYANKLMQSVPGVGYVPVTAGGTAACGFGVYSVTTGLRERTLAGADCMNGYTGLTFSPTRAPLAGPALHDAGGGPSAALFPRMGSTPPIFRNRPMQLPS